MSKRKNTQADPKLVGARVKQTRLALGITQNEVGSCEVWSTAYVSRIEAGRRRPSISALIVLADFFRERANEQLNEQLRRSEVSDADIARLREYANTMTAHYLLTGEPDSECVVCGRHETQGGNDDDDGRDRTGSTRSTTTSR